MVSNSFMMVTVPAKSTAQVDCPVEGKGFSSITIRTNAVSMTAAVSTIRDAPINKCMPFNLYGVNLCFNGGDNTVPKTLYLRNISGSDVNVFIFIEEVGSNPV